MEGRSAKFKKVPGVPTIKKPKNELFLKRKTLGHNLRSSVDRTRDIPPLTPLHRLQRFKAIRDKNLKSKVKKITKEKFMEKMEEITVTAEVHKEVNIHQEATEINVMKENIQDDLKLKNNFDDKSNEINELTNGCNENHGINGETDKEESPKEQDINGHKIDDNETSSPTKCEEIMRHDENIEVMQGCLKSTEKIDLISSEADTSSRNSLTESNSTERESDSVEKEPVEVEDNSSDGQEEHVSVNSKNQQTFEKEGPVENDNDSSSSSSTFPSAKPFFSSSDSISGTNENKTENSEDEEEIDVEAVSTKSNDSESEKREDQIATDTVINRTEQPEEEDFKEEKNIAEVAPYKENKVYEHSKISRSVCNSASSYKTAYGGSLSRISGRRPVSGFYRPTNRKRKAEDDIEASSSGKRNSPSQPSPRWKFFRPSISNLWSPRKTPYDFSVTSTPLKSFDDSMAVNVDEETINCHINDSDLFLEPDETQISNKRSKWGCSIM